MVKLGFCDDCGRWALTGEMSCTGKRLCAQCSARRLGVSTEIVQRELERQQQKQQSTF